jgi:hypothetical protein
MTGIHDSVCDGQQSAATDTDMAVAAKIAPRISSLCHRHKQPRLKCTFTHVG